MVSAIVVKGERMNSIFSDRRTLYVNLRINSPISNVLEEIQEKVAPRIYYENIVSLIEKLEKEELLTSVEKSLFNAASILSNHVRSLVVDDKLRIVLVTNRHRHYIEIHSHRDDVDIIYVVNGKRVKVRESSVLEIIIRWAVAKMLAEFKRLLTLYYLVQALQQKEIYVGKWQCWVVFS